jgi:hypothetical protein
MTKMPRFTPRVLALVCALLAVCAGGARAEIAVGIEAKGVDPMVALRNAQRLDLRDELGRPVSSSLIAAQLKSAQAEASADASFASRLPQARLMARALEFWQFSLQSLRSAIPLLPWGEFSALPGPKTSCRAALALLLLFTCAVCGCRICRCRTILPSLFSGAPVALRC